MPTLQQMATLQLQDFVVPCPVQLGETLQSIALREKTSEMQIRMLNNLLSERAFAAYESVFVPVKTVSQLQGRHLRLQCVGAMQRVLPVRHRPCGHTAAAAAHYAASSASASVRGLHLYMQKPTSCARVLAVCA